MQDFPATDLLTAIAVGIASGLAATGVTQTYQKDKTTEIIKTTKGSREIVDTGLKWAWQPTKRSTTTYLILHHAAGNGSVEAIHNYHLSLGWAGIAYHFYVRKDGTIYKGRPIDTQGGHTTGYNWNSVGICAEGNFEVEQMSTAQREAMAWIVDYVRKYYPNIQVGPHRSFQQTACPGRYYPYDEIVSGPSDEPTDTDAEETGEPPSWAKEATDWAIAQGIFLGDGDGNYRWNDMPTRAELAMTLYRLAGSSR
jgi:N-acetylmuramoyl-L-alanine amidase